MNFCGFVMIMCACWEKVLCKSIGGLSVDLDYVVECSFSVRRWDEEKVFQFIGGRQETFPDILFTNKQTKFFCCFYVHAVLKTQKKLITEYHKLNERGKGLSTRKITEGKLSHVKNMKMHKWKLFKIELNYHAGARGTNILKLVGSRAWGRKQRKSFQSKVRWF